jgi:nondiscriminating glutamyl-tRNA synthetase
MKNSRNTSSLPQRAGIPIQQIDREQFTQIAGILRDNLVILSDVEQYLGIFFDEKFSFDDKAKTILMDPKNRETLRSILDRLENPSSELKLVDQHSLLAQMEEKTGRKGKALYAPLRAAVTGKTKGPELVKSLPLLGRERIIRHIKITLKIT